MQITRLVVRNFRNLADIDISLIPGTVVVGENRSGKSNLIHALRLVLDPSLSYADQQLTREDFWDGLSDGSEQWDPMAAAEVIEVSVEIDDFATDPRLVTALADALLPEDPLRARLFYRFAPLDTGGEEFATTTSPKYRGQVWGGEGDNAKPISSASRSYIHLHTLGALRDVENDIRNWRRSPLRSLLEAARRQWTKHPWRRCAQRWRQRTTGSTRCHKSPIWVRRSRLDSRTWSVTRKRWPPNWPPRPMIHYGSSEHATVRRRRRTSPPGHRQLGHPQRPLPGPVGAGWSAGWPILTSPMS